MALSPGESCLRVGVRTLVRPADLHRLWGETVKGLGDDSFRLQEKEEKKGEPRKKPEPPRRIAVSYGTGVMIQGNYVKEKQA